MMGTIAMPGSTLEVVCWSARTVRENLAVDDELARTARESGRHVLRFWWGGPPAVVMGSSERPDQVVDVVACAGLGVDVLKRSTGGGKCAPDFRRAELFARGPGARPSRSERRLPPGDRSHLRDSRLVRYHRDAGRDFRCRGRRQEDFRQCPGLALESASHPWNAACRLQYYSGRSGAETSAARAPIPAASLSP